MRLWKCSAMTLALVLACAGPAVAQFEHVGRISFPTSGSPEAQGHFLRGVAILHSFGWKQAIEQFQQAQQLQPDFAMAYWGETLCYNHPLFDRQDAEKPRAVLQRLGPTPAERLAKAPTDREKGFLRAVETLWGDGDDSARRVGYMERMRELHEQYQDDHEVSAFYALSLLMASLSTDDRTQRLEVQAGAIALRVFAENPDHPGAAHYVIHAFDDPVHAPLALPAANRFAEIAEAVSHAQHMPTHIFIQHGMWDRVARQNDVAYQVARDLWQPGDAVGDMMHAIDWGQYGYLQLGDYPRARQMVEIARQVAEDTGQDRPRRAYTLMRSRYVVESEAWTDEPIASDATPEELLAIGMSAVGRGNLTTAEHAATELEALARKRGWAERDPHGAQSGAPPVSDAARAAMVMHYEVAALTALKRDSGDEAVALLTEATAIEEAMRPPRGSADPIKPSHELLGEILLQIDRSAEAAAQFETVLLRMPNRPRALLGAARAYAKVDDRERAADRYRRLANVWNEHTELTGYQEARQFLGLTN